MNFSASTVSAAFLSSMQNREKLYVTLGILFSFLLFLIAAASFLNRSLGRRTVRNPDKPFGKLYVKLKRRGPASHLSSETLFILMLVSVWALRFTVSFYGQKHYPESFYKDADVTRFDIFTDSLLHALQTFSMDEEYTLYLSMGKKMVLELFSDTQAMWFGFYTSVLNALVPLAGSAIILQFLTKVFPRMHFRILKHVSWKEKHIFSELNEESFATAKSVLRKNTSAFLKRPVILFTDVYVDDENEKSAELFSSAKAAGMICLPDDILSLKLQKVKKKKFYLMDKEENTNAIILSKMAYEHYGDLLTETPSVYVYAKDESMSAVRKKAFSAVYHTVSEELRKKGKEPTKELIDENMPEFYSVDPYQYLVFDTLYHYPLFTPLANDLYADTLRISILGAGKIGTKMFLNATWAGQISGMQLHLNVCSQEPREEFTGKINSANPDILLSSQPYVSILKLYEDGSEYASPYFSFAYCQKKLTACPVDDIRFDNGDSLLDSDYIFISLGTDRDNIYCADKLSKTMQVQRRTGKRKNPVTILYVVYDSGTNRVLNDHARNESGVQMIAIGDIDSVYDSDNILENKYHDLITLSDDEEEETADNTTTRKKAPHRNAELNRTVNSFDETALASSYNERSKLARSIHLSCQVYSARRIGYAKRYKVQAGQAADNPGALNNYFYLIGKYPDVNASLTWLEHRRWNAYLRSQGYRSIPANKDKSHLLKLHFCLVECKNSGDEKEAANKKPDMLDNVSATRTEINKELPGSKTKKDPIDYKQYDNPSDIYIPRKEKILRYFSSDTKEGKQDTMKKTGSHKISERLRKKKGPEEAAASPAAEAGLPLLSQRLGSTTQQDSAFIESLIEEIQSHPGSCDEVWFATDYGFPPLATHETDAGKLKEQAEKFRKIGVRVSLQLSNSIGHGQYMCVRDCTGLVCKGSSAEHMVDANGTVADYCFCWNGENFRKYTFDALRFYLEAVKPDCLWVDDDLRATNHAPVNHGCFCDGCIEKFNTRYGTSFDREGLVKAIHADIDVRQKHIDFLRDTLTDFTRALGEVVAKAAPGCRMGWQGCANGGYTGYGYDFLFDAMKKATGLAPGSRPGGGAYNDHSPAGFINKSTLIAYQNLMLPDYVKDRRPEIESLPDVVFGKSIPGTCFETSCYLAYGNTAMSYAILMNDYEPMRWHGEMLGAFSRHRKYWEKLSLLSQNGTLSGLTPYFPKEAYLCESKEDFDYTREEIYFAEPLRYLSIPIAFTNKEAYVYLINGRIAETLNEEEINFLLRKNVICDGKAVSVLAGRGYLKNVTAKETSVQEKRERFTAHPANDGMQGRTWGGQIWRQNDYELTGEELEVLSEYYTTSSGTTETVGIASAVFTTPKGAKWACFGFDTWERTKSTEKRTQLLNVCRYLCGRSFPAELLTPLQGCVIPVENKEGKCTGVSIINCTVGESGEMKLRINSPAGKRFRFMGQYHEETSVCAERLSETEYELTLPSIPGWSVGTVFCEP